VQTKGCLLVGAGSLAVMAATAAVLLPPLLRRTQGFWKPVAEMRAAGREFRTFEEQSQWKRPETPTLTAEQLDRFLALRRDLGTLHDESNGKLERLTARNRRPGLSEMPEVMESVSGLASAEMKAYMRGGMPSSEYRYVDRLIYRTWLGGLRKTGSDPASWRRAAGEIEKAAAAEPAGVAARLRKLAADLRARRPDPPTGVPAEIHDLLLSRIAEIDALADEGPRLMNQRF
jgi:hypothetical protein